MGTCVLCMSGCGKQRRTGQTVVEKSSVYILLSLRAAHNRSVFRRPCATHTQFTNHIHVHSQLSQTQQQQQQHTLTIPFLKMYETQQNIPIRVFNFAQKPRRKTQPFVLWVCFPLLNSNCVCVCAVCVCCNLTVILHLNEFALLRIVIGTRWSIKCHCSRLPSARSPRS